MSPSNLLSHTSLLPVFKSDMPTVKSNDQDVGIPTNDNNVPSLWGMPLKYISLVTLALQNSMLTIIMHYSRVSTPPSRAYSAATAVLMSEVLKGLISFAIAFCRVDFPVDSPRARRSCVACVRRVFADVFSRDCWKLSIPAILYVIQNNLQYVAASNLDAATFQVSYQMKILTTAGFSVLLLRKKLTPTQWVALFSLAIGVGVVQIQTGAAKAVGDAVTKSADIHSMNAMKGFLAVVAACFTSGLAGVYFEMVLKNSSSDLWVRNVQLSLFSLLPALAPIVVAQSSKTGLPDLLASLFNNFGVWAWATVVVQVLGGLITALVIKYSDNILKGFATSLSIVISFLSSIVLFDFRMSITFVLGSSLVLAATWLYNQQPAGLTRLSCSLNKFVVLRPGLVALANDWLLIRSEKWADCEKWEDAPGEPSEALAISSSARSVSTSGLVSPSSSVFFTPSIASSPFVTSYPPSDLLFDEKYPLGSR